MEREKIETRLIHSGYKANEHNGSLATPLYQTSTFVFDTAEQGAARFAGEEKGYIYTRLSNPTVKVFEEKMAELEGGEAGLAFASGMAAISAVLIALTKSGDHIICSKGIYGCTFGLLKLMEEKYNITHSFNSMSSEEEIVAQITPETKVVYLETPINPTMRTIDLDLVSRVAKEHGLTVVVDNTFLSPYLQQPLKHGCDVVVHSATKYIGGHGDCISGVVVGKESFIQEVTRTTQKDMGGVLSPFDAWLLIRGLKTLHVRMDRHCENATYIVEKLRQHPKVKKVYYPGNSNDSTKSGGVLSFELDGGIKEAQHFLNQLTFIKLAVSLGDTESLIQHPATMTHSGIPKKERDEMGISDALIRLSVGLENKEDIWKDIEQALTKI